MSARSADRQGPSGAGASHRRRLLAVTAVALMVGGAAAAAVVHGDQGRQQAPQAGALPPLEFEPGVVHVHGLGVDPADGTLCAATHSGLFRLPTGGGAQRVANRAQDTMGFSVVGPHTFMGSGHPDFREDDVRPPLLGLLESTDAGGTWRRLSLHGQADFHALHAVHDRRYGYDSTSETFMVSTDRRDWDRRAHLVMLDLAVSPVHPGAVLATTEQGLVSSGDGGRTFSPVPGAPALVVLAWDREQELYGVGPDGTVRRSGDAGRTWHRTGTVGQASEAVAVDGRNGTQVLYVAATDRGVLQSTDGGRTFTTRYSE